MIQMTTNFIAVLAVFALILSGLVLLGGSNVNAVTGQGANKVDGVTVTAGPYVVGAVGGYEFATIDVDWSALKGVTGYQIEWLDTEVEFGDHWNPFMGKEVADGITTARFHESGGGCEYARSGICPGYKYQVRVRAKLGNDGYGEWSDVQISPTVPLNRQRLNHSTYDTTKNKIRIIASKNAGYGAKGFDVQWKSGEEDWDTEERQGSFALPSTSATFFTLTEGTLYSFRLRNVRDDLKGPWSAPVQIGTRGGTLKFPSGASILDRGFTVGREITAFNLPASFGGEGDVTYALSPELPSGLSFENQTLVVYGTPNSANAEIEYTLTATDSANPEPATASIKFKIAVTEQGAQLRFASTEIENQTKSYITGHPIPDLTLPKAIGGTGFLTYELSPALPDGLSINLAQGIVSGTPPATYPPTWNETTYTWKVTDSADPTAATASITFKILVYPPVIDAGPSQSVTEGETVTLTIRLGTPPVADVMVSVKQVSGPAVLFPANLTFTPSNYNIPQTVSFTAPSVSANTALTFIASGYGGGYDDEDSVTILIRDKLEPVPHPPNPVPISSS